MFDSIQPPEASTYTAEPAVAPTASNTTTKAELLKRAKAAIEAGEQSLQEAAEALGIARELHGTSQAEMARALGISAGYVNLLENNERSLSLRLLMSISDTYGVDWRDLVVDRTSNLLAELRNVIRDPMFSGGAPDLTELRAAIDHAPKLAEHFLHLYGVHRTTLERLMRRGSLG